MKKHHTLTLVEKGEIICGLVLHGNYVIGRTKYKCEQAAIIFSEDPTLIIFKEAKYLSGVHCVLYEDEIGYQLIDGWGQYYSANGVFCNGHQVNHTFLKHGDQILLGTEEIILLYESEPDLQEEEETLSKIR